MDHQPFIEMDHQSSLVEAGRKHSLMKIARGVMNSVDYQKICREDSHFVEAGSKSQTLRTASEPLALSVVSMMENCRWL